MTESQPPRPSSDDPSPPVIPNLEEIEKQREKARKKSKWWHLFVPLAGTDFTSYRSLQRFVKPYYWHIGGSIGIAALSAAFLTAQFWILEEGLGSILGSAQGEVHECPECETDLAVIKKGAESRLDKLGVFGGETSEGDGAEGSGTEGADGSPEESSPETADAEAPEKPKKFELAIHDPDQSQVDLSEEEQSKKIGSLYKVALMLIAFVALEGFTKYHQAVLMATASRKVIMDLRLHVFQHLLKLSTRFHQQNHSAHLVSRITHDLQNFGRFLTNITVQIVREGFSFLAMMAVIIAQHGEFIFVVAAISAVGLAPVQGFARKLRRRNQATQAGMAEIYAYLSEALASQRIVKAFRGEQREHERFKEANQHFLVQLLKVRKLRSLTEALVPTIAAVGTGAVIVMGGSKVIRGEIEGENFMLIILALARAMGSLRIISRQLNGFHIGMAAAERVSTLLSVESEIVEKEDAKTLPPFEQAIRFEGVRFSHKADKPTLKGIDLEIRKGETVALVGPSGAGKSTLADLLPRFFDPDGGRVTIDGHDIRDVTVASLRDQIGMVTQETLLFRDSVAQNIAYGRPDAEMPEIRRAAVQANAHQFIRNIPKKYGAPVGEKGSRLSGGERQRIAIARALLHNAPILILDEATSALDSESEILVQKALNRLMRNRTTIVIAHRLSTVRDADRIVVLEQGEIVEMGKHDELLANPDGVYTKLYDMQLQGLEAGKPQGGRKGKKGGPGKGPKPGPEAPTPPAE